MMRYKWDILAWWRTLPYLLQRKWLIRGESTEIYVTQVCRLPWSLEKSAAESFNIYIPSRFSTFRGSLVDICQIGFFLSPLFSHLFDCSTFPVFFLHSCENGMFCCLFCMDLTYLKYVYILETPHGAIFTVCSHTFILFWLERLLWVWKHIQIFIWHSSRDFFIFQ